MLSDLFAFAEIPRINISLSNQAMLAGGQLVSGGYFSGLGVKPHLGRLISPSDDRPGSELVVVLSYADRDEFTRSANRLSRAGFPLQ